MRELTRHPNDIEITLDEATGMIRQNTLHARALGRQRSLTALLLAALLSLPATLAWAQQPGAAFTPPAKGAASGQGQALQPATTYDLNQLRLVLRAYHGFTAEALQAATTEVPRALRELAGNPAEAMLVRRQAVKALGLFPDPQSFTFVSAGLNETNIGLKRLYVAALAPYAATHGAEVTALLNAPLNDGDALVRTHAAKVALKVPVSEGLRGLVNSRLQVEADANVRGELQKVLAR